ncbi:hypothetical protein PMIN04_000932 [Paraphaeosphaeria minitans]
MRANLKGHKARLGTIAAVKELRASLGVFKKTFRPCTDAATAAPYRSAAPTWHLQKFTPIDAHRNDNPPEPDPAQASVLLPGFSSVSNRDIRSFPLHQRRYRTKTLCDNAHNATMSLFRLARLPAFQQPLLRRTFFTTRPLFQADSVVKSLKPELMTAMRAKDKPRLTVLRALLAEITNASKTNKPVDDDPALYSLLAKQIKDCNAAVEEFVQAKREDLVEKERSQIVILQGFLNQIEAVPEETVRQFVEEVVAEIRGEAKMGAVMGKVVKKLGGKPVDMVMVGRVVEEVVGEKS